MNEAVGINSFELVDPLGDILPPFTAGAHIDVVIPGGLVRQYSLCNDPRERHRYVIAVLHVVNGRGGSRAMHADVRAGDDLTVSLPRSNFSLIEEAPRHLIIAGGIGATPLMAMIERLEVLEAEYVMHYCSRSPERTAFRDRLADLVEKGRVVYHHDDGDPAKGLRVADVMQKYEAGTHLYYCGPPGLMEAVGRESSRWPAGTVHSEYFAPPPTVWPLGSTRGVGDEFSVKVASSGDLFPVPLNQSIVEVLRAAGIDCETSCESGVCGTCRTRYLAGTPEHHDFVLDDNERETYVMICCARASSEVLVLDL